MTYIDPILNEMYTQQYSCVLMQPHLLMLIKTTAHCCTRVVLFDKCPGAWMTQCELCGTWHIFSVDGNLACCCSLINDRHTMCRCALYVRAHAHVYVMVMTCMAGRRVKMALSCALSLHIASIFCFSIWAEVLDKVMRQPDSFFSD